MIEIRNMMSSTLVWADLAGTTVVWADLSDTDLAWANLARANLARASNLAGGTDLHLVGPTSPRPTSMAGSEARRSRRQRK